MRNTLLEQTRDKIKDIEQKVENKTYSFLAGEICAQQALTSLKQKERVLSEDYKEINAGKEEFKNIWAKLNKIEEKNRCLRVQFLDWLSVKMHSWADGVKAMSDRIDSPCIIKVEPKRKTK
jgi:hypothetical protein